MRRQNITLFVAGIAFLVLILDAKTALSGAAEGIRLCLQTVIPSLFPFLFISIMLTSTLTGHSIPILRPLCRLLRIPEGAESILLIGLLGGYPVGAQCVAEATRNGTISRENGCRLLTFCSNAGPAFIFGIGSNLFQDSWMCWALWGIHIISALLVGLLTPGFQEPATTTSTSSNCNMTKALQRALRVMATICGWVVIFRVLITFCEHWFLWLLPVWIQCLICGMLELTNGCCMLAQIGDMQTRFILCSVFLSFGGLCVTMQTYSVTEGIDASLYLPGKIKQAVVSALMAGALFSWEIALACVIVVVLTIITYRLSRKKAQKRDSILTRGIV